MLRRIALPALVLLILALTGCTLLGNLPQPPEDGGDDGVAEADLTGTAQAAGAQRPAMPDPSLINPTPMDMPAPTGQPGGTCGLNGALISSATIADGTAVPAGEVFQKTWRLLNSGCADWPEGTQIMHVGGLAMGAPPAVPVDPVAVNAIAEATVLFRAPVMPGPYRSFWQLATPEGIPFGQVYHVDIIASAPEIEAAIDQMRDDMMEQMEQNEMNNGTVDNPPDNPPVVDPPVDDPPIDDPTLMPTVTPTPTPPPPADDGGGDGGGQGDGAADDGGGDDGGAMLPPFALLPTQSFMLFQQADLVVDSVEVSPNPAEVGETVTLIIHIKNQGMGAAPAYSVNVGAGGQSVTRDMTDLPAGFRDRVDVTFTFDEAKAYTVLVYADVGNTVAEVDESNNDWVSNVRIMENMNNIANPRAAYFRVDIFVEDHDTLSGNETERQVFEFTDPASSAFIESKRWDVCADNEVEGTVIVNYYLDMDNALIVEVEAVLAEGPSCSWGNAVVDRQTTTLRQLPDTESTYSFQLGSTDSDNGFIFLTVGNQTP